MGDGKITSSLSNVWGNIVKTVTGKLPDLEGAAKDTVDALEKLVSDSGAASLASRGAERLGGYMQDGMEAVSNAYEAGAQLVNRAVDTVAQTGQQLATSAIETGQQLASTAAETGGKLADAALEGLEAGVNKTLPVTVNDMGVIGRNVLHFLETGQLSAEQRFILSKLTPDASFSLSQLSAQDIGKFVKVAGTLMVGDGAKRLKAESGLLLLLVRGDLTREPANGGQRLLDVLAERANKPADPRLAERGLQMAEALSDVIEEAAMPMIVRQGKGSSTCVAGSLQAAKAAEDPAGYADMVLRLIQDGHVTLTGPDGKPQSMSLDTGDIDDGHKGQDLMDAAVQGSMVAFAKQAVPDAAKTDDEFGGGRVGGGGRFGGGRLGSGGRFGGGRLGSGGRFGGGRVGGGGRLGGEGDGGLTLPQADFLYETMLGRKGRAVNVDDKNAELMVQKIEAVAGDHPVQVGLQAVQSDGSIGGHMLAVQGTSTDADGQRRIVVSDSNSGEITALPREEFQKLLIGAILPE